MSAARLEYLHRVTYADCTLGNHVYHSRYFDILEAARGEFFRQAGFPLTVLQDQDTIFPVLECRAKFRFPARYDDLLKVAVWVTLARGVRLHFAHQVTIEPRGLILEAETLHACTNVSNKPKRLPPELLDRFCEDSRAGA